MILSAGRCDGTGACGDVGIIKECKAPGISKGRVARERGATECRLVTGSAPRATHTFSMEHTERASFCGPSASGLVERREEIDFNDEQLSWLVSCIRQVYGFLSYAPQFALHFSVLSCAFIGGEYSSLFDSNREDVL